MTKTAADICTLALQKLNVTAVGEAPAGEDMSLALSSLNAFFARFNLTDGAAIAWELSATPDEAFLPLSDVLAAILAPVYMRPAPMPMSRAVGYLREYAFPNDITDSRDTDEDGSISDAEAAAGRRAAYY